MLSSVAHILLSSVKRRSDAFGLALAKRATGFDATGLSSSFVGAADLNHCLGKHGRESGHMLG